MVAGRVHRRFRVLPDEEIERREQVDFFSLLTRSAADFACSPPQLFGPEQVLDLAGQLRRLLVTQWLHGCLPGDQARRATSTPFNERRRPTLPLAQRDALNRPLHVI